MSSIDVQDRQADDELRAPEAVSYFGQIKLRALVDVVFGGAALALLLAWLVLSIAGERLG